MQNALQIQLNCPKDPSEILSRLRAAGYHAYVVGGCVRDTLLGIVPHDWDITTSALPEQILATFSDEHTIPTGLKHGTVTVMMNHIPYEVTTFRIDGAYTDSRHPESVTFSDRISDDLSRRDFTINALAWSPESGVVDCFSGIEDLKNRRIRAVGIPKKRFEEDALRILRGYRFAAQLGFEIEENTRSALISESFRLKNISRERISSEFCRLITSKNAVKVLKMLEEDGIFAYIFDGTTYTLPESQILCRMEDLPAIPEDRLAFLLLQEEQSTAEKKIKSLRLSNKIFCDIVTLTDPQSLICAPASPYNARRLLAAYGNLSERALHITACYGASIGETLALIQRARQDGDCVSVKDLKIGGKDLISEGIAKGAALGNILNALLDLVLHNPAANERKVLLSEARRMVSKADFS